MAFSLCVAGLTGERTLKTQPADTLKWADLTKWPSAILSKIIITCLPWLSPMCWCRLVGGVPSTVHCWYICLGRGRNWLGKQIMLIPSLQGTQPAEQTGAGCADIHGQWKPGCPSSWHLYLDLSGVLNWYNMKNVTLGYCTAVSHRYPWSTMPWPCLPSFPQQL